MKRLIILSGINLLLMITGFNSMAQDVVPTNYRVIIKGTSNLYDWDERVEKVKAVAKVTRKTDKSVSIESLSLSMDVYSIKSSKGRIMDHFTYKAMKASKYPEIRFDVASPVYPVTGTGNTWYFKCKANITVAGVTRNVDMNVQLAVAGDKIVLRGKQKIKMTDFNITPPTVLMGMLKTGNEISVDYDIEFTEATISGNF
jgi:polyisoprenoid-binding protein YceI